MATASKKKNTSKSSTVKLHASKTSAAQRKKKAINEALKTVKTDARQQITDIKSVLDSTLAQQQEKLRQQAEQRIEALKTDFQDKENHWHQLVHQTRQEAIEEIENLQKKSRQSEKTLTDTVKRIKAQAEAQISKVKNEASDYAQLLEEKIESITSQAEHTEDLLIDHIAQQKDKAQQQIDELNYQLNCERQQSEKKSASLKAQLEDERKVHAEAIAELRSQIKQIRAEAQHRIEQAQQKEAQIEQRVEKVRSDCEKQIERVRSLNSEKLNRAVTEARQQEELFNKELSLLKRDSEEKLQKQRKAVEAQTSGRLITEKMELKKEKASLLEKIRRLESEICEKQAQIEDVSAKMDYTGQKRAKDFAQAIVNLNSELAKVRSQAQKIIADRQRQLTGQVAVIREQSRAEIEAVKTEYSQKLEQQNNELKKQMQQQTAACIQAVAKAKNSSKPSAEQIEQIRNQIEADARRQLANIKAIASEKVTSLQAALKDIRKNQQQYVEQYMEILNQFSLDDSADELFEEPGHDQVIDDELVDSPDGASAISALMSLTAGQIMRCDLPWISPEKNIEDALAIMKRQKSEYIIVGTADRAAGILGRVELIGAASPAIASLQAKWKKSQIDFSRRIKLKWIINPPVCSLEPDTSVTKIFRLMREHGQVPMPVTTESGLVHGVVLPYTVCKARTLLKLETAVNAEM